MNIREMLLELGYSNISEYAREYRTRPIYRESDNNSVLRINKSTGRFVDFAKSITGSFEDLVKLTLKLKNIAEAQHWVSHNGGGVESSESARKPLLRAPRVFPKDCLKKLVRTHLYWIKRGVSEQTISQFEGGVVLEGKMKNRYVFPILDGKSRLIGVSGRYIYDNKSSSVPKWKHIGDKHAWKYPLFLNHKIIQENKQVILVESIGDMLALWDAGIKNSIVTFGLEISPAIMGSLLRFDINKIYISFNNDSSQGGAGNTAATKAAKKLINHFDQDQVRVSLPTKNDFGEMNREEIKKWVKNNIYQHQE